MFRVTTPENDSSPDGDGSRPLSGVRVLEFGHVAAGPFAASLLADLGADVVKIESPSGDQMRSWPPLAHDNYESFSHNFASINRNKRSFLADLKDSNDLNDVYALVREADVIVENYRPGTLDRLGLGFDNVASNHKGLVYCSISGYGAESPYANHAAYDVVIQGMSGLMSITGEPGGSPVKAGVPVADFISGLYSAYTITALLSRTRNSGHSLHIDCPMLDCMLGASALQTSEYWGTGKSPKPLGSAHPRNAPYQSFKALDRDFIVAAGSHKLWVAFCEVTNLEYLISDLRFDTQVHRAKNQQVLAKILQKILITKPAATWVSELSLRGVPASLVNTYEDILTDEHVTTTKLVHDVDVPAAGRTSMVGFPVRINDHPMHSYKSPPRLGENTTEILYEWLSSATKV